MACIKVLLYKGKTYSDGTNPVVIQIIENKKVVKKVIHRCLEKHWDTKQSKLKSNAPNSIAVNQLISTRLAYYQKALINSKELGEVVSSEIFDQVKTVTLAGSIKKYCKRLVELKRFVTLKGYQALLDQVLDFKDTPIDKIDKLWLEGFCFHLQTKMKNTSSTINKKISRVKGIVNTYSNTTNNEVRQFKVPIHDKVKLKLTKSELDKLINLNLTPGDILEHVRDFLYSKSILEEFGLETYYKPHLIISKQIALYILRIKHRPAMLCR